MKTLKFQKTTKRILPFAVLFVIAIIFFYKIPLTAYDRLISLSLESKSLGQVLSYSDGNFGRDLIRYLCHSDIFVCNILLATFLVWGVMLVLSYSEAKKAYLFFLSFAFVLMAPKEIFVQTYASLQGAVTVLFPSALLVLYLFSASDLFRYNGRKKGWKIPLLFIYGFFTALFDDRFTLAALLISLCLTFLLFKKCGFSLHMLSHLLGVLGGLILNLCIGGNGLQVVGSFYGILDQLDTAINALFIHNWIVVGTLTLVCLLLIQPIRSERSKKCRFTMALLIGSMFVLLFFRITDTILQTYKILGHYLTFLKAVAAGAYLYAVLRVIRYYVSKEHITTRVRNNLLAVVVFILVFTFMGGNSAELLYLPFLVLIASTVTLFVYVVRHYRHLEDSMKHYFLILGIVLCGLMCVISVSNANTVEVMEIHTRDELDAGKTEILLPALPYGMYGDPALQVGEQIFGESYTITFVPYDQWDWAAYREAHNVPAIEEYDQEKANTENDIIFEEEFK